MIHELSNGASRNKWSSKRFAQFNAPNLQSFVEGTPMDALTYSYTRGKLAEGMHRLNDDYAPGAHRHAARQAGSDDVAGRLQRACRNGLPAP
jgi:hypothetical protein